MKFTDLTGQQRSVLSMLATNSTFNTKELGLGVTPKQDAQSAAQLLMDMRDKGLIFSSQKLPSQAYAQWRTSEYGKAVFESRPDGEVGVGKAPTGVSQAAAFVVYRRPSGAQLEYIASYPSEVDALNYASRQTDKTGDEYHVAKLVARVKPVTQPTFEIERV